jgi:predicted Zn-dependent protease
VKALALAAIACLSCATVPTREDIPSADFLYYCWDTELRNATACEHPSRVRWAKLPVLVYSDPADLSNTWAAKAAISVWNEWLQKHMFAYTSDETMADVSISRGGPGYWVRAYAMHYMFLGVHKAKIVVYDSAIHDEETMAHELGHILGLAHDHADRRSIMYPTSARVVPWLQARDRAALKQMYRTKAVPYTKSNLAQF